MPRSFPMAQRLMRDPAGPAGSMSTSVSSLAYSSCELRRLTAGVKSFIRTETKAISVYPVKDILASIPPLLHPSLRLSQYYTAGNDSLTFQAQTHRSRTANAEENRKKLVSEITQIYERKVPAETGSDKHAKYKEV